MLQTISKALQEIILTFPKDDSLLLAGKSIHIKGENFRLLNPLPEQEIAFIDGGQAELLVTGNICVSFVRIAAQIFQGKRKVKLLKQEFYLLTLVKGQEGKSYYVTRVFSQDNQLIEEEDLQITCEEREITQVTNIARRFAELSLAAKLKNNHVILDGTLEPTYPGEEKYLAKLGTNVSALAKTSILLTQSGNSPLVLLDKIGPPFCWQYVVDEQLSFVKLHPKAKHVFRFTGNKETLAALLPYCTDALFLGYPYGLLFVDKIARVSNTEKKSLRMQLLLRNSQLNDYLRATNAHDILDSLS